MVKMTDDQEKSLRFRLGLLSMAVTAGREGDMKSCTEIIIECVDEFLKKAALPGQRRY